MRGPAADECQRLLRDAAAIWREAEKRRAAKREEAFRLSQQQEVSEWLHRVCSLEPRAADKVMTALASPGFGFDTIAKIVDLVPYRYETVTRQLPDRCQVAMDDPMPTVPTPLRHRYQVAMDDPMLWPRVDAAEKMCIIKAVKGGAAAADASHGATLRTLRALRTLRT